MTHDSLRLHDPPSLLSLPTADGGRVSIPYNGLSYSYVDELRARVARLEHLVAELIEARRREENDGR